MRKVVSLKKKKEKTKQFPSVYATFSSSVRHPKNRLKIRSISLDTIPQGYRPDTWRQLLPQFLHEFSTTLAACTAGNHSRLITLTRSSLSTAVYLAIITNKTILQSNFPAEGKMGDGERGETRLVIAPR